MIALARQPARQRSARADRTGPRRRPGNAITVRHGKGGKRHIVGIDEWGWEQLQPWLTYRRTLPVGALTCVLSDPTAGRLLGDSCVRRELHKLDFDAGVRRRIAPHQLRHALACELAHEPAKASASTGATSAATRTSP